MCLCPWFCVKMLDTGLIMNCSLSLYFYVSVSMVLGEDVGYCFGSSLFSFSPVLVCVCFPWFCMKMLDTVLVLTWRGLDLTALIPLTAPQGHMYSSRQCFPWS